MKIDTNYALRQNVSMKGNLNKIAKAGSYSIPKDEFVSLIDALPRVTDHAGNLTNEVNSKALPDNLDKVVYDRVHNFLATEYGEIVVTIDNLKTVFANKVKL